MSSPHPVTHSRPASARHLGPADNGLRNLRAFLDVLVGREPDGLLEVRTRRGEGMAQRFYRGEELQAAAEDILRDAPHTDVYTGCAPRSREAGGRDAIRRVWTLWVEIDDRVGAERLRSFRPSPAIVVRSGSGQGRHAYWPLLRPVRPADAERANRRLAHALHADPASVDCARILRPPATFNHKHDPPAPVVLERLRASQRFSGTQLVGGLPDPPGPLPSHRLARAPDGDDVRDIPPQVWVAELLGQQVGRDSKVSCPFHTDGSPSLHVYSDPARGFYCFGCRRGGSIYDLAGELWGVGTRGADFIRLRARLRERFGLAERAVEQQPR